MGSLFRILDLLYATVSVENYVLDDSKHKFLPNGHKCKKFSIDVKFICFPKDLLKNFGNDKRICCLHSMVGFKSNDNLDTLIENTNFSDRNFDFVSIKTKLLIADEF